MRRRRGRRQRSGACAERSRVVAAAIVIVIAHNGAELRLQAREGRSRGKAVECANAATEAQSSPLAQAYAGERDNAMPGALLCRRRASRARRGSYSLQRTIDVHPRATLAAPTTSHTRRNTGVTSALPQVQQGLAMLSSTRTASTAHGAFTPAVQPLCVVNKGSVALEVSRILSVDKRSLR